MSNQNSALQLALSKAHEETVQAELRAERAENELKEHKEHFDSTTLEQEKELQTIKTQLKLLPKRVAELEETLKQKELLLHAITTSASFKFAKRLTTLVRKLPGLNRRAKTNHSQQKIH